MSNVAKLKKQAAEYEAKKQFDKALAIYIKLLDSFDENASELDVALFNRVGDLLVRQGNVADAVDYYEKAVDLYEQTGFFNNAIALCNKILRQSPGRTSIYYKLGKASAKKGFNTEAKVNFLEYADRMQKSGNVDEAFRALTEFADLCPDQDEIRVMLADQLIKANRKDDAVEQLQILHERFDAEGRGTEAASIAARIHAINPTIEPRTSAGGGHKSKSGDLVFLDLGDTSPAQAHARRTPPPPPRAAPPRTAQPPAAPPAPPARRSQPAAAPPPDDIPLLNTDDVIGNVTGTPSSVPLVSASLDPMHVDDSLGVVKSTPTSSFFAIDPSADDNATIPPTPVSSSSVGTPDAALTPMSSPVAGFESTSLIEEPPIARESIEPPRQAPQKPQPGASEWVQPPPPAPSSPPPTPAEVKAAVEAMDFDESLSKIPKVPPKSPPPKPRSANEFTIPSKAPAAAQPASIDFDLSTLVAPETPQAPNARRPTQARNGHPTAQRGALDELPLVDGEARRPAFRSAKPPRGDLPSTPDLELIVDPALGMTSVSEDRPASPADVNDETLTIDDDVVPVPNPSVGRRATLVAAHSVEVLRASVDLDPEDWSLRRQLAEAMLEAGHRADGIAELEVAMNGAERSGDLDLASSLAEEIARLEPEEVRHHQKRVEYAFRTNDRSRLIEAYVALADALLKTDQGDKARTVYQRVLDLAPDDVRARAAIDTLTVADEIASTPTVPAAAQRSGIRAADPRRLAGALGDSFVNLGDWVKEEAPRRDTRMVVAEQEPTGDEEADFADMLRKFKQGVAENVDPEDYQSHYDLAIAYKEMGLIDEAIAEFQKALGGASNRLPTYEALGQCFIEKTQYKLASSILTRALNERAPEEQLVGVLYLLGRAAQAQGLVTDAVAYYHRVFVVDIQFRDTAERLSELERTIR